VVFAIAALGGTDSVVVSMMVVFVHDRFFQALDSQLTPLFNLIEEDSLQKIRFVVPFYIESDPYADVDVVVGIWGPACLERS